MNHYLVGDTLHTKLFAHSVSLRAGYVEKSGAGDTNTLSGVSNEWVRCLQRSL
jgi:hypothetical protein